MRWKSIWASATLAALSLSAAAQTTRTYEYDALGRLVRVTPSSGNVACYAFDPADNRSTVSTTCGAGGNSPPTAVNDTAYLIYIDYWGTIYYDGTIDVLYNDTDPNLPNETLTITGVSGPGAPHVSIINGGSALWFSQGGPDGVTTFTYTIRDSANQYSQASVTVEKYSYFCYSYEC